MVILSSARIVHNVERRINWRKIRIGDFGGKEPIATTRVSSHSFVRWMIAASLK